MPCDYSKYPENWKTEIRPAILARAKDCCEECGIKNHSYIFRGVWQGQKVFQVINGDLFTEAGDLIMHNSEYEIIDGKDENAKAIKVILTVAHVDHNTENNDYSNLKAWCQLHHLRHDILHHKKNSTATRDKKKGLQSLF